MGTLRRLGLFACASTVVLATMGVPSASAADPGRDGAIAFARANQVYVINPDGTGLRKLTSSGKNYRPRWSPDGKRMVYVHQVGAQRDLWVMNADGSNKVQVTHLGTVEGGASWSPDGTWLAFGAPLLEKIRAVAPFGNPVVLPADTGDGPQPIGDDGPPAWSPDGRTIAFYSHDFPDSPDNYLLLYDVATSSVYEWDAVGGACCGEGYFGDPAWAPKGQRLAYTALDYDPESQPQPAGPHVEVDSYPTFGPGGFPAVLFDKQPAFSPSGTFLAVENDRRAPQIFVARANGAGRHLLTSGYQPDWQPLP
jgi:Tol biopolymer transport system component